MLYAHGVLVLLCSIILANKMETGCRPVTCGAAEGWPLDLPVNGSPLADGKKQMIVSFTVKQTIMYSTIINYTLSDAELS